VFTVTAGSVSIHIEDDVSEVGVGDAVVVPPEAVHSLEAGPDGASLVVTMLAHTKLFREGDGSVVVPPWVS
jgi:quercetin dioxygenase-like cupin family protein